MVITLRHNQEIVVDIFFGGDDVCKGPDQRGLLLNSLGNSTCILKLRMPSEIVDFPLFQLLYRLPIPTLEVLEPRP